MKNLLLSIIASFWLMAGVSVLADDALDPAIVELQHEWAKANYNTPANAQEAAFKALSAKASEVADTSPDQAEAKIWHAIILSGYAKVISGWAKLNALKLVDQSKTLLLESIALNPNALHGSAYTSLGSLYYKVPVWPISFGDKDKAKEYLEKSLEMNPKGIDSNYFYADFLYEQGRYARAVEYYERAIAAPARLGREEADQGRRKEAKEGLLRAKQKLN
jgi:tetratricopeptide (TPR) repeat protein